MPSNDHELPLEMVRHQPALVPELLRSFGNEDIPWIPDEIHASLTSETYSAFHPQELRCDATVLLGDPEKPSLESSRSRSCGTIPRRTSAGPRT